VDVMLVPMGSSGDVNPFLGLGAELQRRGHQVQMVLNGHFVPQSRALGLDTIETGDGAAYAEALQHPDLWHPIKGPRVVLGHPMVKTALRLQYQLIQQFWSDRPKGVVISSTLSFAGRIAREVHPGRLVTAHLQPQIVRSHLEPMRFGGLAIPRWVPRPIVRLLYGGLDRLYVDPLLDGLMGSLRGELGLPKVHGMMREWLHSPDLSLGLFPKWFMHASDWPAQFQQTDFLVFDGDNEGLSAPLLEWIQAGPPPLVATFGTGMAQGGRVFEAVIAAAEASGERLLLLTPFEAQIPKGLPASVRHEQFAPLAKLLPLVRMLIHHGGIGTTSRGLLAGVPQFVVPFGFDQYDNAAHVQRLGCGQWLAANRLTDMRLQRALAPLIHSDTYRIKAQAIAAQALSDGLQRTCELLENRFD
jgi:rhamnosyltransferase subunit B